MAARDPRALSFGSVATEYDRLRPAPAPEAVSWLLPEGCSVAVDVAAGTGLFTRALVDRVPCVIAVEPDDRMRAVLAARTPGVQVLAGRGEDVPLPDACADLLIVASAWHWLDPERAIPEFARILRPGGRLALAWTTRDRHEWFTGLDLEELGLREELPGRSGPERRHREVRLPEGAPFADVEIAEFGFVRRMTKDDGVALLATFSRLIAADRAVRERALAAAREALDRRFPGAERIDVPHRTCCWRATRVSRSTSR